MLLIPLQSILAYEVNTSLVQQKLHDPSTNLQKQLNSGGNQYLPQVRKLSLRDSGRNQSSMFTKNINFRYYDDIGFYISNLTVSLKPNNPSSPVLFDQPDSFTLQIHKGSLTLSNKNLNDLLNQYTFNFKGATVRKLHVTTESNSMILEGEMLRDQWLPFKMEGKFILRKGHLLVFTPNTVFVNGVNTTQALAAANVKLSELLKIKAKGVDLIGSEMILDALTLFPPPKLELTIKSYKLDNNGLQLEFDDGITLKGQHLLAASDSYLLIEGGDIKIIKTMPLNVSLQIDSKNGLLNFYLYNYKDQLAAGYLTLTEKGAIHAFFP